MTKTTFHNIQGLWLGLDHSHYATIEVHPSGEGFACEVWISARQTDVMYVVGSFSIPVFGADEAQAFQSTLRTLPKLLALVLDCVGGVGVPIGKPTSPVHAMDHGQAYVRSGYLDHLSDIQRTAALYELLSGFRITAPAIVIAQLEGVSARTIHDRVYRARKDYNLLPNYGKGRSYN